MTNRTTIPALAAALAMALALAVPPTFATDAAPTEKDPVAQARTCKHELRKKLKKPQKERPKHQNQ